MSTPYLLVDMYLVLDADKWCSAMNVGLSLVRQILAMSATSSCVSYVRETI